MSDREFLFLYYAQDLDSLNFNAEKAEYDIKTQQLKVSRLYRSSSWPTRRSHRNNEVLILENAKSALKNTTIVLDTLNGYHRLTRV